MPIRRDCIFDDLWSSSYLWWIKELHPHTCFPSWTPRCSQGHLRENTCNCSPNGKYLFGVFNYLLLFIYSFFFINLNIGCCEDWLLSSWSKYWCIMELCEILIYWLQTMEPETETNDQYKIANRLVATFGPMLLYWHHWTTRGKRIATTTLPVSF